MPDRRVINLQGRGNVVEFAIRKRASTLQKLLAQFVLFIENHVLIKRSPH